MEPNSVVFFTLNIPFHDQVVQLNVAGYLVELKATGTAIVARDSIERSIQGSTYATARMHNHLRHHAIG